MSTATWVMLAFYVFGFGGAAIYTMMVTLKEKY